MNLEGQKHYLEGRKGHLEGTWRVGTLQVNSFQTQVVSPENRQLGAESQKGRGGLCTSGLSRRSYTERNEDGIIFV